MLCCVLFANVIKNFYLTCLPFQKHDFSFRNITALFILYKIVTVNFENNKSNYVVSSFKEKGFLKLGGKKNAEFLLILENVTCITESKIVHVRKFILAQIKERVQPFL